MMTKSEARQRLTINGMVMGQHGRDYCVMYGERPEFEPYWTDDLEDAVIEGAKMRRRMTGKIQILVDA